MGATEIPITTLEILEAMRVPGKDGLYILGCLDERVTLFSQQTRALNLVYALDSESRLHRDTRVAVIGGGAAGLTAAVAIALLGCQEVRVFERHTDLLHMFTGSETRYIHPHIYDWPQEGWDSEDAGLPLLNWSAGIASIVATHISESFALREAQLSNLEVLRSISGLTIAATPIGEWSLRWETPAYGTRAFDIVIFAVGFGTEPQSWLDIPTNRYWQNDDLNQPQSPGTTFLVSGCGDGGLVDLLRIRIKDFRHDQLHGDFLSRPSLNPLLSRIQELESFAANKADSLEQGRLLTEGYLKLETPEIENILRSRLRLDTAATLHSRSAYPLSANSSALNRFLVSRLFRLSDVPYTDDAITGVAPSSKGFTVYFKSGREIVFHKIIVRHGPQPALLKDFKWIWDLCKAQPSAPRIRSGARHRLYPLGFFENLVAVKYSLNSAPKALPHNLSSTDNTLGSRGDGMLVQNVKSGRRLINAVSGLRPPRVLLVKSAIKYPIKDFDFGVPLGLWALHNYLKREGIESHIYDERLNLKRGQPLDFESVIEGYDIIGFSVCSCEVPEALEKAIIAKSRGKVTVFGGIFVLTNHEFLLAHPSVDYVIPGVATRPLGELTQSMARYGDRGMRFTTIPGVYTKENTENGVLPLMWETGTLSSFDFSTLDELIDRYAPYLEGKIDIVTARGCPYRCDFCSIQRESQRRHVTKNDADVIDEIAYLAARGLTRISIKDEIFPILIQRAAALLKGAAERAGTGLEFKIKSRVDILMKHREVLKDYYAWGVREIQFGVETMNPQMLNMIHKGYEPETDVLKNFLEYVADLGIMVNASFILGIQGESQKYYESIIKFVSGLSHLDRFKVYVNFYTPHPMFSRWTVPAGSRLFIGDLRCFTHKIPLVCPSTLNTRAQRLSMVDTYEEIVRLTDSRRFNPALDPNLKEMFVDGGHDYSDEPLPVLSA